MTSEVNALKAVEEPILIRPSSRLIKVESPMAYNGRAVRGSTWIQVSHVLA